MFNIRHFALAGVLLGALATTGCYADADVQGPVVAEGYTPQYYGGSVVYFDGGGRPFYYMNGAQVWVPESSPYYYGYVNHWRAYGPAYNRWYGSYGYRYQGYRGPANYYGGYRGGVARGGYRRR